MPTYTGKFSGSGQLDYAGAASGIVYQVTITGTTKADLVIDPITGVHRYGNIDRHSDIRTRSR